jgi:hypothetical protein
VALARGVGRQVDAILALEILPLEAPASHYATPQTAENAVPIGPNDLLIVAQALADCTLSATSEFVPGLKVVNCLNRNYQPRKPRVNPKPNRLKRSKLNPFG